MNLLHLDLNVRLYTPHREYVLGNLFKGKQKSYRIQLSRLEPQNIIPALMEVVDKNPVDALLLDPWVVFEGRRDDSFLGANLVADALFEEKCKAINDFASVRKDIPKIIMGSWMDVHSLGAKDTENFTRLLHRSDFYFWGTGKNSYVEHEQSLHEAQASKRPHTNFYRTEVLKTDLSLKVLPYLHSIPEDLHIRPAVKKCFDDFEFEFNVPGSLASYPGRRQAKEWLLRNASQNFKDLDSLCLGLLQNFRQEKSQTLLNLVNYLYLDLIQKSRINYVDGGKMDYVTMKYLESALAGTLLLSPEMTTLEEYGFKSGVHYVPYKNVADINFSKEAWDQHYEKIRDNAFELVTSRHTTEMRMAQFKKLVEDVVIKGSPNNFRYFDGRLFKGETEVNV